MEIGFLTLGRSISKEFRRYLYSSFAGNLAIPIYSLFVPLLASKLGATLFEIGVVGGASNAVYSFLPLIMGHFSDRRGSRRFFIVAAFVVLTVVSIFYVFATSPIYLIVARVFEGVGWAMLWPAMDAAVSRDVAPSMESKEAFSIYNVSWSGAAAIGPLLGSALIFLSSLRVAFLATVLIMSLTLALNLIPVLRHENESVFAGEEQRSEIRVLEVEKNVVQPVNTAFYAASCALAAVSSGVLFTFFAPYARSLGISILVIGLITFVFGLGRFLFYIASTNGRVRGIVLRQDRRNRNMMIALILTSVSSLLISVRDPSGVYYIIAYGIVGVGISITLAIAQAGIIAESSAGRIGRSAGVFESSIGIGACAGPIIGGAISGSSLAVPFIVPPIGFVIFLAFLPLLMRKSQTNRKWFRKYESA